MRVPIILAALGAGAFGFAQWLARLALPGVDLRDEIRGRFRDGLGWWSPAMAPHWAALEREGHRRAFHNLKNLLVEWVTSDPQRAGKALAFWGAAGWLGWWVAAALAALLLSGCTIGQFGCTRLGDDVIGIPVWLRHGVTFELLVPAGQGCREVGVP